MRVATYEGVVQDGQVKLEANALLPNGTKVLIVVPGLEIVGTVRMMSPRLVNPADAALLTKEVTVGKADASLHDAGR